jgi:ATP-dependent Clp protease ATP-binding subunit ClpC
VPRRRGKSRKGDAPGVRQEPEQDVADVVRAAARSIARSVNETHPSVEDLANADEFVATSDLLTAADVPLEIVERLARSSTAIVAAMADRALARRPEVSGEWLAWAFKRLKRAYAGEVFFLLEAIERHAEPPLIASVLANVDNDWSYGWLLDVCTQFVERRVRAGEEPTGSDFDVIDRSNEQMVADVVAELEGVLSPAAIREFEEWRRRRGDAEFFQAVGRVWHPPDEPRALLSVGGRSAAQAALVSLLGAPPPDGASVLLVGERGVGKSAVLREALRELHADGWFIFEATPTELIAGQVYIGELDARLREIAGRVAGRRALWVMPAFDQAVSAGQHSRSRVGALDKLFPYVEAGQIRVVGELEPRAYDNVLQQRPRLASAFETLRLEPLTAGEALSVAKDWRDRAGVSVEDATIADAFDLAGQYLPGLAAPGGPLRLLKAAAQARTEGGGEVATGDVLKTLSEATGLPLHVVDPQTPLDLDEVRAFFATRIVGQSEAVDCLVERIALVKAGLTDPTRPLGVFLFVGPTGTGKTELAKALAEFLFGSPDRLVRLDMSEFQTYESLERLLGGASEQSEGAALISSVRRNPFSIVLLDEFEKAHRDIWSVFLQLFDDGRLTDRFGRTADFRQCVVILTSNLGAALEPAARLGFASEANPRFRKETVERSVSKVFPPEFVNRIDRIVVFHPFERDQIRALLERELERALGRRGFRAHPWAVEWDEAALEFLAEKGFSVELGARPLKRAIERYVLSPLAAAIVSRSFPEGEQFLFVTARNDQIEVTFVDPDADDRMEPGEGAEDREPNLLRLERLVLEPTGGPDETAFLQAETERLRSVIEGEAWLGVKERDLEALQRESFWESADRFAVLARIEYVDRVQAAFRTAEKLLGRILRQRRNGHRSARNVVELLAARLYLLDRACAATTAADPSDAYVDIRTTAADEDAAAFARRLQEMYESWARLRGMRLRRLWSDGGRLLAVSGIGAHQILAAETGLHVLESPREADDGERSFDRVAVQVTVAPAAAAPPDADAAELAARAVEAVPASVSIVRRYRDGPAPLVRDSVREWRTGRLDRVLAGEFDVILDR